MVQHILPKNFQRVRYFGLQHTASFKKWYQVIAKLAGDLVDAMVSYAKRITYAKFFEEIAKRNPLEWKFLGIIKPNLSYTAVAKAINLTLLFFDSGRHPSIHAEMGIRLVTKNVFQ